MDTDTLRMISRLPVITDPRIHNVPAKYIGTRIPLPGQVTIDCPLGSLDASLDDVSDWETQMLRSMAPGTMISFGGFFRDVAPGYLLENGSGGAIVSDAGDWEASGVVYSGQGPNEVGDATTYRFNIRELIVRGPAFGSVGMATRTVFAGGSWEIEATFDGATLLIASTDTRGTRIEDETLTATIDGTMDDVRADSLWLLLSFVSGNRIEPIATEIYDGSGNLIETRHRRSGNVGRGRHKIFSDYDAPISPHGLALLGDGVLRLKRSPKPFPIEIIIEHLLTATTNNVEIDAQHCVLAIHCAIEAWNRNYGLEYWIDDDRWEWFSDKTRRSLLSPIYDTIGPDMVRNLASTYRHANQTQTGWRQLQLFSALGIELVPVSRTLTSRRRRSRP